MNIPYAPVSFTSRCHLRAVVIYESVVHVIYEFEKFFVHIIYDRQKKKKSVVNDTGAYGIILYSIEIITSIPYIYYKNIL